MKELSIEEKAKAYDRAIEELRGLLEGVHEEKCEIMEEDIIKIFPELKESEDEKIRKRIISALVEWNEKCSFPGDSDDMIAWLEKQGEQKPEGKSALEAINEEKVDNANKVKPKGKVKYAGNEYNVLEAQHTSGVTYYGIEDEPDHIDYVKAENCEIISGYAIKENGSPYPTNPAWSEEDEKLLDDAIGAIGAADYYTYDDKQEIKNWLKSLKNRVHPQPKQGTWRAGDNVRFTSTIQVLEYARSLPDYNQFGKEDIDKNIAWFKHLKERYTWKPSDKQMEALSYVVILMASSKSPIENDYYFNVFKSLREQIKKLREE